MAGDLDLGVYFGLSQIVYRNFEASTKENIILRASPIYPMVMSIGWNPFYKNSKKSCETHVMHDFGKECFYGETLKIVVLGYIRPEKNYNCLDDLIKDIHNDIDICRKQISCNQTFLALSKDDPKNPFFQSIMQ